MTGRLVMTRLRSTLREEFESLHSPHYHSKSSEKCAVCWLSGVYATLVTVVRMTFTVVKTRVKTFMNKLRH